MDGPETDESRDLKLRIKVLGHKYETMQEADENSSLDRPLQEIFDENPELLKVWDDSRLLANLRLCASASMSKAQTAQNLGFDTTEKFNKYLAGNEEAKSTWKQCRITALANAKMALTEAAKGGNQAAIRAIEAFLLDEGGDMEQWDVVDIDKLSVIFGMGRKAVYNWTHKPENPMPKISHGKYCLPVCVQWYIDEIKRRAEKSKYKVSPLAEEKVKQLQIVNAKAKGELLERGPVIHRFTSIYQSVLAEWNRMVRDLSPVLENHTESQISEILTKERRNFVAKLREIPSEFNLSREAKEAYTAFLNVLKTESGLEETD